MSTFQSRTIAVTMCFKEVQVQSNRNCHGQCLATERQKLGLNSLFYEHMAMPVVPQLILDQQGSDND